VVYIPHTDQERQDMLHAIGVSSLDELFADIPEKLRYPDLGLTSGKSEVEVIREIQAIAAKNTTISSMPSYLGAGAYHHWVPSVVEYVINRGEFATAYTPYQAEVSQGTLQAIFEYQSLICDLTGMEVANASHYDGATSTAEAVIQAYNVFRKKRQKVLVAPNVHPQYREVVKSYTQGMNVDILYDDSPGTSIHNTVEQVNDRTACIILQSPNFLGSIEPLETLISEVRRQDSQTLVVVITNPLSLGLFTPPGDLGADIVVGDGQPLGLGLNYGGPYLGFYATRFEYVRQMSGRLIGRAKDIDGQDAYVMTLTTREQHIRRDRATSNICTNQGLMALAATVYLSILGKHGLRQIAELNYHKAHYAAEKIDALPGYTVEMDKPFFNEFIVVCPKSVKEINLFLLKGDGGVKIIGGYDLSKVYREWDDKMLVAVTEMNTREEIDAFVTALSAASSFIKES
jgi:glycine dehydrogenase subunit 1